jgi:bacillithiol synthase
MGQAFSAAFVKGDPRAVAMLPDDFRRAEARARGVKSAPRQVAPGVLVALRARAVTAAQHANVEQLSSGAAAVLTGQQVGLFLGPLFTLYKAASAVVSARALTEATGRVCVPVFWLQSEDHDFDEVASTAVLAHDRTLAVCKASGAPDASRKSIGSLQLGSTVDEALETLQSHLQGLPHADAVMGLLRAHYRPSVTWVDAFAGLASELFGGEGLLFLDPRRLAGEEESRAVYRWAFEERDRAAEVLKSRESQLSAGGFAAQVHVRERSPLFFFHPDGPEGPRFRLEERVDGFGLVGDTSRVLSAASIRQAIEQSPNRLSTSALLRPLLQDALLPTCATVVGPGEVNYFAQLGPLYQAFGRDMPTIVPRARFRLVDSRTAAHLRRLGLSAEQAENIEASVGPASVSPTAFASEVLVDFERRVQALPELGHPDVQKALKRTRATIQRAALRLGGRVARAGSERQQIRAARLDRVRQVLLPRGEPQERVLGWASLAARVGVHALTALVLNAVEPFVPDVKTVAL